MGGKAFNVYSSCKCVLFFASARTLIIFHGLILTPSLSFLISFTFLSKHLSSECEGKKHEGS
jgi:hypothetical protein